VPPSETSFPSADRSVPPAVADLSPATPDEGEAELAWRGGDPVVFSQAEEILRENGIVHYTSRTEHHLAFGQAMPRPRLDIYVGALDAPRTRELLAPCQDTFPLVPQEPSTSEERSAEGASTILDEPEASAGFARRKSSLRWAIVCLAISVFLATWIQWVGVHSRETETILGQVRIAAVLVLLLAAPLTGAASFWNLYRAWAWRADKVGLLTWFFGFFIIMWFGSFVLPALLGWLLVIDSIGRLG
jgi:hypothetical protein